MNTTERQEQALLFRLYSLTRTWDTLARVKWLATDQKKKKLARSLYKQINTVIEHYDHAIEEYARLMGIDTITARNKVGRTLDFSRDPLYKLV